MVPWTATKKPSGGGGERRSKKVGGMAEARAAVLDPTNGLSVLLCIAYAFEFILMLFAVMDYGGKPPPEFDHPYAWLWSNVALAGAGGIACIMWRIMKEQWWNNSVPDYWTNMGMHISATVFFVLLRVALLATFVSRFDDYLPAFNTRFDVNIMTTPSVGERTVLNYISGQWNVIIGAHIFGSGLMLYSLGVAIMRHPRISSMGGSREMVQTNDE